MGTQKCRLRHGSKWAYWTQRAHGRTVTMSPDCLPSMRPLQQVPSNHQERRRFTRWSAFSPSLVSSTHLFIMASYSSIYHLALLSVEIVCLSLVSQRRRERASCPGGIAPHNPHLAAALGTVKPQRLPLNLGECWTQASSKLLNNQCVVMVTGACTVLACEPA